MLIRCTSCNAIVYKQKDVDETHKLQCLSTTGCWCDTQTAMFINKRMMRRTTFNVLCLFADIQLQHCIYLYWIAFHSLISALVAWQQWCSLLFSSPFGNRLGPLKHSLLLSHLLLLLHWALYVKCSQQVAIV